MRLALGLMAAVVVVEGLPMLGADVGGVLSMVPAFGVTALVLLGRRIRVARGRRRWRWPPGWCCSRSPSSTRRGPTRCRPTSPASPSRCSTAAGSTFSKNLGRRWQASLGGAELAGWITVGAVMVLAWLYAVLVAARPDGPRATRPLRDRPTLAAVVGLAVLGTVGLVANDSSVAVPLTMLIVVAPAAILQAVAPAARGPRPGGGPRPRAAAGAAPVRLGRGVAGSAAGGAGVVIRRPSPAPRDTRRDAGGRRAAPLGLLHSPDAVRVEPVVTRLARRSAPCWPRRSALAVGPSWPRRPGPPGPRTPTIPAGPTPASTGCS